MTDNFNIRDNLWDPLYPHHSSHSDNLFIIVDSFNLELFISTNQVSTKYSDNCQEANLVLNLMSLHFGSDELDNHIIYLDWRLTSDHTPLIIIIPIIKEHIQTKKWMIVKESKKEYIFVKELIKAIKNIETNNIPDIDHFNSIVLEFASLLENIWAKNLKIINITKHSKSWWNMNCSRDLETLISRFKRSLTKGGVLGN